MFNEEVFAAEYSRLVTRLVRRYFLRGGDYDDLYQEGMIGLLYAIRRFDPERSENFEAFASTCIKNRLLDALRRDIAANDKVYQTTESIQDFKEDTSGDPESKVLADESAKEIKKALTGLLSAFEVSVLDLYLEGYTVKEAAEKLNKPSKSVDNAIIRIRNKLKRYLQNRRQQEK